jgi:hypothetical protein
MGVTEMFRPGGLYILQLKDSEKIIQSSSLKALNVGPEVQSILNITKITKYI